RQADLVIGEFKLLGHQRHRVLQPGEDVDVARPAFADQPPSQLQFREIILGAGQDLAVRVGQVGRVRIAEAVEAHAELRVRGWEYYYTSGSGRLCCSSDRAGRTDDDLSGG